MEDIPSILGSERDCYFGKGLHVCTSNAAFHLAANVKIYQTNENRLINTNGQFVEQRQLQNRAIEQIMINGAQ